MGSTEYLIVICFLVTIWSNSADADIDCRRFVFAPSCRGVSAKRSPRNFDAQGQMNDVFPAVLEVDRDSVPIGSRKHKKRFTDLLKRSLLRETRSEKSDLYNYVLKSIRDDLYEPQELID